MEFCDHLKYCYLKTMNYGENYVYNYVGNTKSIYGLLKEGTVRRIHIKAVNTVH
jgi:hypothetical protein